MNLLSSYSNYIFINICLLDYENVGNVWCIYVKGFFLWRLIWLKIIWNDIFYNREKRTIFCQKKIRFESCIFLGIKNGKFY